MLANKAFGFTPDYVMWQMDQQMLNEMFAEHYYFTSGSSVQKDEHGEYEWITMQTIDGEKKYKRYFDKIDI